jgi:hypothetical protein
VAYVTSQHGYVHHNAIIYPSGYVFRILQESDDPRFQPCGNGIFSNNIIIVNSSMKNFFNIGKNTNPQSFTFSDNLWYDTVGSRVPDLPTSEKNPVYNVNPQMSVKKNKIKFLSPNHLLKGKGPDYYKK